MESLGSTRSPQQQSCAAPASLTRLSRLAFLRRATLAVLVGSLLASGCTWKRSRLAGGLPVPTLASSAKAPVDPSEVSPTVATAGGVSDLMPSGATRMVSYVTGKSGDLAEARKLYQSGDATFRKAEAASKEERADIYRSAAKLFRKSADESPIPALQQDAMFMEAESLFLSNQLTSARDVFEKLQKEFPNNRHSDKIAARLFTISQYWIDVEKAGGQSWADALNPLDKTVPWFDTTGHAIKVLDQIRYDNPTGRLADDATMAAAAENIRQGKFDEADEFLTDLRETFPDSDHLFLAHLLGVQCKLQIYGGPDYSGIALEEAEALIRQTRSRFPKQSNEKKYADMLARAAAEVSFHQAAKLETRAQFREKRGEYQAASQFYREIISKHSTTPQATIAEKRLKEISGLPAKPAQRLAWLTKIFPDAKQTIPLETVETERAKATQPQPEEPSGGSFFR
ncbi:Tetratricopeptide repeat protein [Stieleria varia]|uniref:Tetratricopeptide repeat protein n=2 Tax=Stieleria varia TaxID=2528005 RepID=A0A5C6B2J5_9BACT|nr:Tetratricopeptide repeat protein [Stieleria varia]